MPMARLTMESVAVGIGLGVVACVTVGLGVRSRSHRMHHEEDGAPVGVQPLLQAPSLPLPDAAVEPSPRCEALLDANHRVLDDARRDDADCDLRLLSFEDASFCVEGARAMWGVRLATLVRRPQEGDGHPCDEIGIEARLVHLDSEGRESSVVPGLAEEWPMEAGPSVLVNLSWSSNIDPPEAFDFDGDGDPEIFIAGNRFDDGEENGETTRELFSFKAGAISTYVPADGIDFDRLEDVDGDGRPDLVGRGAKLDPVTRSKAPIIFASHSLLGGRFSSDDAAARTYTRTQCPISPTPVFAPGWMESKTALDIVCMRAWGVSRDVIEHALDARCHAYEDDPGSVDVCPTWSKQLAAMEPPFTL